MINSELYEKLRERHKDIHPLIFVRSLERAKTPGDAFDILESYPRGQWPVVWSEEKHCWVATSDMLQSEKFDKEAGKQLGEQN